MRMYEKNYDASAEKLVIKGARFHGKYSMVEWYSGKHSKVIKDKKWI